VHPAASVIFFTTASGAGYGLLILLGLLGPVGLLPAAGWFGFAAFAAALGFVTAGLLASTFHLGHPERAWRALSQWRTSWLSREGVVSIATYLPAGLFALGWVFFDGPGGVWAVAGVLAAAGAVATLWCTGMIYASLKPVPRWHNKWVVPNYLALGLATGAVLLNALAGAFGAGRGVLALIATLALGTAWALKTAYWRHIDTAPATATAESATGLGGFGKVRLLEAPHTEESYLQKEMGFRVARKHAATLRRLVHVLAFGLPLLLSLILLTAPASPIGLAVALLAVLSAGTGVVVERWLFFAEAKHVVVLYYGEAAA
jgi:sulfite dehydrogenase (quinone) subunit SoeC